MDVAEHSPELEQLKGVLAQNFQRVSLSFLCSHLASMAFLGCVECGKNLIQNEALGLVIQNGFHQPIEDDTSGNQSIQLSASQEYFEKFLNEDSEDDETNVSLSADEWMNFKTHKVLYFDEDEDTMRSDFVEIIEDYKSSFKAERWVSECQCPQCRVLQVLALERAYIIKNATLKADDIKIKVSKRVMENIYFGMYDGNSEDCWIHPHTNHKFKKHEWDAILDKWEAFKVEWQYHLFHYHCDVRHGLIDTMWSAIGIPVQVIRELGTLNVHLLDIRICGIPLWEVEIDHLREAVWSEIGDSLMSSGWRQEELFFKAFTGILQTPFRGSDGDLLGDDDDEFRQILIDNPNLELVLVNLHLTDDEEEEETDNDTEQDDEPVSLLARQMFEPYITKEQDTEFPDDVVGTFKEHFIESNELDLEPDDLRVVWQDRDLEDYESWAELGYGGGDTINIQVFIRGRGGGGGKKRKLEDIIEEKEDYSNKLTGKTSEDNPFKAKIENLYEKMASDEFGQPIADLVQSMGQEQLQHLSEKYWGSNHSKYERYLPEIADNLVPLMGEIVKVERHASEAKKYLNAILEEFFVKEFNDGTNVKNELFETLLEVMTEEMNKEKTRIENEEEIERRAQQRAQQLLLQARANAPSGDVPMTPVD